MRLSVIFFLLFAAVAAAQKNPCHQNKFANGRGVTCEKVFIPPKLCSACKLKPFKAGGNFRNCRSIYDLEDPACIAQLRFYASRNAFCDPVRPRQVRAINNPANKEGLDYFVYSVCEECCDCIPKGALENQYEQRRKNKQLLNASRGNCPAHAVYDICLNWPQVRFVSGFGGVDQFSKPKVCPLLRQWLNSPQSNGWATKNWVPMNPSIREFLWRYMGVAKCANKEVWQSCNRLERAQGRL